MNVQDQSSGENWTMFQGDCCEVLKGMPDNSIDFGIHSPPFSLLYIYSASEADMGNSANDAEFIEHYKYAIKELFRVTVSGRLCAVHCKDLPKYANRDDTAGLKDFPGDIIDAYEECGWSFHSRITIWKCPVTERERTNNNGLLHKTVLRDRSQVRQGMADYLLLFRKPPAGTLMSDKPIRVGSDEAPIGFEYYIGPNALDPRTTDKHPSPFARKRGRSGDHKESIEIWRRYAEPVWWDIDQTNVLNFGGARSEEDERHICPLQMDVIERAIQIWSLPSETVLSCFAGIGSEGVGAIHLDRKFVGVELKAEYFKTACRNLSEASSSGKQTSIFDLIGASK